MVREKYPDFIESERELIFMTDLDRFKFSRKLENVVIIVVPKAELDLCKNNFQLSIKDRLVLTFIKLKHNLAYTVLCTCFI